MEYTDKVVVYSQEIEKYRIKGASDEWYISKLIETCVSGLSSEESFAEIENLISLILEETEWDILLIHIQYMLALAKISGTTEMPKKFK